MANDNFFRTNPLGLDAINGLTLAAGVTQSADFTPFYSASAGNVQRTLITNMFGGFTNVANAGFVRLPSGFILQWMTQTASTTPTYAAWTISFPTAAITWAATSTNQTGAGAAVQMTSNTAGTTYAVSTGTPSIRLFAFGY